MSLIAVRRLLAFTCRLRLFEEVSCERSLLAKTSREARMSMLEPSAATSRETTWARSTHNMTMGNRHSSV